MCIRRTRLYLQVWRWAEQYKSQVAGQPLAEMTSLIAWLEANVPADDADPAVTRISHGDYRCVCMQSLFWLLSHAPLPSLLGLLCMQSCCCLPCWALRER